VSIWFSRLLKGCLGGRMPPFDCECALLGLVWEWSVDLLVVCIQDAGCSCHCAARNEHVLPFSAIQNRSLKKDGY
jgi:hypothetical protein